MEFDGKEELAGRLTASLGLRQKISELQRYKALALALARRYRPDMAAGLGVPVNAEFGITNSEWAGRKGRGDRGAEQDTPQPDRLRGQTAPLAGAPNSAATSDTDNSEFRIPNSELEDSRAAANLAPLP